VAFERLVLVVRPEPQMRLNVVDSEQDESLAVGTNEQPHAVVLFERHCVVWDRI